MVATPPDRAGLCASCRFAAVVTSSRGSSFYMCTLSQTNSAFRRYPVLPVLQCAGYQRNPADLPDPPASIAMILAGSQASLAGITQTRNSKVGEMELDGGDMVISGVKTVQVEIKE